MLEGEAEKRKLGASFVCLEIKNVAGGATAAAREANLKLSVHPHTHTHAQAHACAARV